MLWKSNRNLLNKYGIVIFLAVFVTCCSFLLFSSPDNSKEINRYYTRQLNELRKKIIILKTACDEKQNIGVLKNDFLQSRLSYKKLAILSEYYYVSDSRLLNGPAIDRIEDDNPDKILPPHGFQVVENHIFGIRQKGLYKVVSEEASYMLQVLDKLGKQPDREYMFRNDLTFDALRSATVRLITLGITGYDSPTAMLSLPEGICTLKGLRELLLIFKQSADKKTYTLYTSAVSYLDNAITYLKSNNNFNNFDRLYFIIKFINPFYKHLVEIRKVSAIAAPDGSYPMNFNALSIFSDTAFNINFFSPGGDYKVTNLRIELGKKLFYDPILSGTKDRSCASCHKPELAFTDGLKTALSIDQKTFLSRNTPTLLNSGFQSKQFFDSRADILENQLDEVVHNSDEMKGSLKQNVEEIKKNEEYTSLFQHAYKKDPISGFNIANAISSYIRSLQSLNSRFDKYMRGNTMALTESEKKGFNLFMGKAKCATCHHPPLFNGLLPPEYTETESEILGVPATADTLNTKLDADLGKYLFTRSSIHMHSFKTPTLRNIQLTAPYMHNGVYKTLEDVMSFYNKGGGKGLKIAPENQTLSFDKLGLSKKEMEDVINFMKSLTDINPSKHLIN